MKKVLLNQEGKYRGYYSILGVLIPITKKYDVFQDLKDKLKIY